MKNALALKPDALPTPKDEAWKYTNLPRAIPKNITSQGVDKEIVIHKNGGQPGAQLEEILFTGLDKTLHTPVLSITLEQGVEFTLVERHEGTGSYWKNMVTNIVLKPGAIFHHIRIQEDGIEGVHTNMVNIKLGRDATYQGFALNAGAKLSRLQAHATITGPNAHCSFDGINIFKGDQHGDTTILIEHQAPNCTSNQFYRTVLAEKARGVFQGKVYVHQAAQKTDGYQLSNALLLSDQAEMDTKPELEIYADDVKCSHGATTGQLDDEPLFYLRSRGIDLKTARMLLVQAFVDEVADKLADESVQNSVKERTSQWLQSVL